jgi:hypothetical protein
MRRATMDNILQPARCGAILQHYYKKLVIVFLQYNSSEHIFVEKFTKKLKISCERVHGSLESVFC